MDQDKVWVEIRLWGGLQADTKVHRTLEGARASFEEFKKDYSKEDIEAMTEDGYYTDNDEYMHLYDAEDRHTPEISIELVTVED